MQTLGIQHTHRVGFINLLQLVFITIITMYFQVDKNVICVKIKIFKNKYQNLATKNYSN